jgi:hypothetical protein
MGIPPSYVIFIWYLLFIADIVPYNPFWWLVIALVVVILTILQMMYYRNDFRLIFLFILINIFIKIIPIYHLLSKDNYTNINKINIQEDIVPGLVLMGLYVAWITNGTFSLTIIEKTLNKIQYNIQHNKPISPIIKYIYRSFKISNRLD